MVESKTSDHISDQIIYLSFHWSDKNEIFREDLSKVHDHIQIKPSEEPQASSKAPNEDLKDIDVLYTFKMKLKSQNLNHGCIKEQWQYPNQNQDAKPQSGASSLLQISQMRT